MTRIAHVSDTHFGTERPEVVRAAQVAIAAAAPDIVVLSGDITQRARPSQFHAAAEFLQSLPAETKIVIPGNHDIPLFNIAARLFDPYGQYRHVFGLRENVWCHDDVGLIGYDATSRWRHTRGKLDAKQLSAQVVRARQQLKPGAVLIACAHQPLVTAWPEDSGEVLIHAGETAGLLAQHSVDIILSGHVHVPLIATTRERFPHVPRHFILSGAGTAVSHRTRPGAPNSFNVIDVAQGAISITLMEYGDRQFTAKSKTPFALSADGWKNT